MDQKIKAKEGESQMYMSELAKIEAKIAKNQN